MNVGEAIWSFVRPLLVYSCSWDWLTGLPTECILAHGSRNVVPSYNTTVIFLIFFYSTPRPSKMLTPRCSSFQRWAFPGTWQSGSVDGGPPCDGIQALVDRLEVVIFVRRWEFCSGIYCTPLTPSGVCDLVETIPVGVGQASWEYMCEIIIMERGPQGLPKPLLTNNRRCIDTKRLRVYLHIVVDILLW